MNNLESGVITWEHDELVGDTVHSQAGYSHGNALEICTLLRIQKEMHIRFPCLGLRKEVY